MQIRFQVSPRRRTSTYVYVVDLPAVPALGSLVSFPYPLSGGYPSTVLLRVGEVIYDIRHLGDGLPEKEPIVRVLLDDDKIREEAIDALLSRENTLCRWKRGYSRWRSTAKKIQKSARQK